MLISTGLFGGHQASEIPLCETSAGLGLSDQAHLLTLFYATMAAHSGLFHGILASQLPQDYEEGSTVQDSRMDGEGREKKPIDRRVYPHSFLTTNQSIDLLPSLSCAMQRAVPKPKFGLHLTPVWSQISKDQMRCRWLLH